MEETLEICIEKCLKTKNCKAFVYDEKKRWTTGNCWLKHTTGNNVGQTGDDFIGGYRCDYEPDHDHNLPQPTGTYLQNQCKMEYWKGGFHLNQPITL